MTTSPAAVSVRDLTIIQPQADTIRTLLSGVSFDMAAGGSMAIVGESGSGKSLTVRALLGLLPEGLQASGRIEIAGHRVDDDPVAHRRLRGSVLSLLMQDPFTLLNPLRKVGRQLADGLAPADPSSDTVTEVTRRLAEVGLDAEIADRYPYQLSGGMRQRVGIAAALAGDPSILIADEPTTALDVTTQREVLTLVRDIQQRRGMTFLIITHDLRVAFSMADQVLVLYAGRTMESGPSEQIPTAQLHPYTQALLAAEPPTTRRLVTIPAIPGSVPRHDDVVAQCAFADRCHWVRPQCRAGQPEPVLVQPGHTSACMRVGEIAGQLHNTDQAATAIESTTRTPTPVLLDISEAQRTFRGMSRPALDRVNVSVRVGEAVGIVGESGSGKTTLARCAVGLDTLDGGTVRLNDHEVTDYARLSRRDRSRARHTVQMVFQDPYSSLNPVRSIGSTLREALRASGQPADGDAVEALLELVGLPTTSAPKRPASLSGGERQRVAIARAIACRPGLLVCDESVSALDVTVQAQILDLIAGLRDRLGMALLFITHDLAVVRQVTDFVYVLSGGQCVESGATARVLDSPEHPYTRALLASVPGADASWLTTPTRT